MLLFQPHLPWIIAGLNTQLTNADRDTSDHLAEMWTNLATYGKPTPGPEGIWKP